jgi:hypothetical protein
MTCLQNVGAGTFLPYMVTKYMKTLHIWAEDDSANDIMFYG